MAKLIKTDKVDFPASFATIQVGEDLEFPLREATESALRSDASRYSERNNVILKVVVHKVRLASIVTRLA